MTQTKACAISKAVWDEFSALLASETKRASATFLPLAARFSRTWHEERFSDSLAKFGLTANILMSFVGSERTTPYLEHQRFCQKLGFESETGQILLQGNALSTFKDFWSKFRDLPTTTFHIFYPQRPTGVLYSYRCPGDESQTLKKRRYHDSAAATTYRQKWHSEKESNPCRARLQLFGKFLRFTILMERYACKGIQP